MKYFINFLRNVKFNSVHNVIHKTFSRFSTVQRSGVSHDDARDLVCYSPVNNVLSLSRDDARETV